MKTRYFSKILSLVAVFAVTAQAAPFLAINDNAEVFLVGVLGVRSDSNIYLSNKATSDVVTDFAIGAELKFGDRSAANGILSVIDSFSNFADHSGLNTNLATARFNIGFDDGKLKLSLNSSYAEMNDNQVDNINGDFLVRRNILSVNAAAEVAISQKTSLGGGFEFSHTDYRRKGYADSDIATIPFNYYMEITPKVDLSLGYRYRNTEVTMGQDSRDDFFNIGSRGQFTPKLSGQFNVGFNRRKVTGGASENQLGVTSNFTYAYSPKTNFQFGVSNDFGTTGQGKQTKNLTFSAGAQSSISEEWSIGLNGTHRSIEYIDRSDTYMEGQVSATYTFNANVRVSVAYAHRVSSSPLTGAEFTGDVLSLVANFRY